MNLEASAIKILSWFLGILVIAGVSTMMYYFIQLFFTNNKRQKLIAAVITGCIVLSAIFIIYRKEYPSTVQCDQPFK